MALAHPPCAWIHLILVLRAKCRLANVCRSPEAGGFLDPQNFREQTPQLGYQIRRHLLEDGVDLHKALSHRIERRLYLALRQRG